VSMNRSDRPNGSIHAFHDRGDALANADAHRREAVAAAALLHFVNQRRHDARAAAPEWMAEGDGATVDVQLIEIDT